MAGRKRNLIENPFHDLGKIEKRYRAECLQCGATFESYRTKTHICRVVNDDLKKLYANVINTACKLCGKNFGNKSNAKKHLRLGRCKQNQKIPTATLPIPQQQLIEMPKYCEIVTETSINTTSEHLNGRNGIDDETVNTIELKNDSSLTCNQSLGLTSASGNNKDDEEINTCNEINKITSKELATVLNMSDSIELRPEQEAKKLTAVLPKSQQPLTEKPKYCETVSEARTNSNTTPDQLIENNDNVDETANAKAIEIKNDSALTSGQPLGLTSDIENNKDDEEIIYVNTYKQTDKISSELAAVSNMINSIELRAVQKVQEPTIFRPVYIDGPNVAYE